MSNKKIPITRNSMFFGSEDFKLQEDMGMEWLHGWLNFSLVLYSVDREKTDNDDVYGEASPGDIRFYPPVEFNAYVQIAEPSNSSYSNGLARYNEPGNLRISVYLRHLKELNIDIRYGDYIGYVETEDRVRYYNVVNDGKITSDLAHTIGGYKAFYRTIVCSPVQEDEFKGI